jgi:hypothetical protein
MPRVDVYDPPMCCSTGVCGPVVDPALPRFAGDLAWLGQNGVEVARFNLAQEPLAFTLNPSVLEVLKGPGPDALPVVLVDGSLASQGRYPSRDELAAWTGLACAAASEAALSSFSLPTASCCGPDDGSEGSGCCG